MPSHALVQVQQAPIDLPGGPLSKQISFGLLQQHFRPSGRPSEKAVLLSVSTGKAATISIWSELVKQNNETV
jgi:hypothetical protein